MKNENFTGRNPERKRLESFLNNKEGGSIFIAGRRGSGKTSLLKEVLSARTTHPRLFNSDKAPIRYFFNKQIQLYIPLIIVKAQAPDRMTPEVYRSLILRSIAFALYNYSKGREYYWLPMSRRYFQSIGLVRQTRKLKKYVEYTTLSKVFKSSVAAGKDINVGFASELNATLDMSDAKLEMVLRELMSTYSIWNDITIIFDELDKLEGDGIAVQDVVLYLKNLFSDTGVHAVFVGSEAQGYEILNSKDSADDNPRSTLFRDVLILKGLDPEEFSSLVQKRLQSNSIELQKVTQGLAIMTNTFPFNLNSVLDKHDSNIDRVSEAVIDRIGYYQYLYHTTARIFVNHIYKKHRKTHNPDFNNVLYQALCLASEILVDMKIKYVSVGNLNTLFFTTNLFTSELEEKKFKEYYPSQSGILEEPEEPSILKTITSAGFGINSAVAELITLLERSGWMELSVVVNSVKLIQLTAFKGDTFTINNIDQDFEHAMQLTEREKEIKDNAQKFIIPFRALSDHSVFWENSDTLLCPFMGLHGERATLVNLNTLDNTRLSWNMIESKIDKGECHLVEALSDKLGLTSDGLISDLDIGSYEIKFTKNGKRIKMLYEFVDDKMTKDNTFDKTIILRAPGVNVKKLHSNKVKYFVVSDWGSTDDMLQQLQTYLGKL